ncbi:antitoxin Xre-like helix-turn-helix domain-containing protein [Persicitalea jodogahamensis]|uniref:Antitoxin Xre-like helix-turn-helix domain-containing protein n=1 Tax=Persicitalea jodogahamensis TaxID=402147 RepID=A0A8J3D5N7_9BACT|nr:antitoxin Xre-like helix-turn-helix domain-containing protein [Persicitalea jodogahamensis]GHB86691.1 hypothetical protein GCM10007390_47940 [Persicitalea jodogahamensis]
MASPLDINSASGWGFPTHDLILQARRKLPRNQVDRIAILGGLTKKEMARILGVTERNLYNQHHGDLSVPLSERLLLLEKLFQHGLAVFDGRREAFFQWLRAPLAELATPEVGFAAPSTPYSSPPIREMGTKDSPPDLTNAAAARRTRLQQRPAAATQPPSYPTPLSLLDTITGYKLVDNVFIRMEAGVFS